MVGVVTGQPIADVVIIPPGKWQPDVPLPTNKGLPLVLNLVPRSNGFYGPERSPETFFVSGTTAFGNALKVQGNLHSIPAIPGGVPRYYAGTIATASGDSRIVSREEQGGWSDLSRAAGYTSTATQWYFANFGNKVVAANRANPTQISDGGAGVFRDITGAPRFTDIAVVAGFLMGINYIDNDFGGGAQPYGVAWSAIGDAENWPDPSSDAAVNVQSGVFPTLVGGGPLGRIIPGVGGADAVIIADRKVWRVNYVGQPEVFQFDEVQADQGTSMTQSVAAYNEVLFMYGYNGFYFFDGQNATPIGQGDMDQFFVDDLELSTTFGLQRAISASIDTFNKNYVLSYRSKSAVDDRNDRILRFNWLTREWSNSAVSVDALGNLDNNTSSTDSPGLFAIGSDFQLKTLTGSTLEATIHTGESFATDGSYTDIQGFIPFIDTDQVEAAVRVRDQLSQAPFESSLRGLNDHGVIPFDIDNISGRFYACRIRVPAGEDWTAYQGGMYEIFTRGKGSRSGQGSS